MYRNQTALLTIEFRVHPPADAGVESTQKLMPHTLLVHRCPLTASPLALLQAHVTDRTRPPVSASSKKRNKRYRQADISKRDDEELPAWIAPLTLPHADVPDAFEPPAFFLRASQDPLSAISGLHAQYVALDGETPLSRVLKGRAFVEFPTIEVCEVSTAPGRVAGSELVERPRKRRRMDVQESGKAIGALVGAYGSESEDEKEEKEAESGVTLGALGEYLDEGEGDLDGYDDGDDG